MNHVDTLQLQNYLRVCVDQSISSVIAQTLVSPVQGAVTQSGAKACRCWIVLGGGFKFRVDMKVEKKVEMRCGP